MYSPDGRRIVTLSNSPMVHTWRVGNLPFVYRLDGHRGPVTTARFSADGQEAWTASVDGTVIHWRTPAGRELEDSVDPGTVIQRFEPGAGSVDDFFVLEDESQLLTLTRDGRVSLFDCASGERRVPDVELGSGIADCALRSDGRRLVVVDRAGAAWLLTPAHGGPPIPMRHERKLTSVDYASDGRFVVLAGEGDLAWVHDGDDGALLRELEPIEFSPKFLMSAPVVVDVSFRPGSAEVALACSDRGIRFRNAESGAKSHRSPDRFSLLARKIEYDPQGEKLLITGVRGGAGIALVDPNEPDIKRRDMRPETHHSSHITTTAITADGTFVISGSVDESVHIWDARTGLLVADRTGHEGSVSFVTSHVGPDGLRVLSARADGGVFVWPADPVRAAIARKPRELAAEERARERKLAAPLPFD